MKSKDRVTLWGVRIMGKLTPELGIWENYVDALSSADRFNLQGEAIDAGYSECKSERVEVVRIEITPV